jgi:hypothetical protein
MERERPARFVARMERGRPARFVAFPRSEATEILKHEAGETPALQWLFPRVGAATCRPIARLITHGQLILRGRPISAPTYR